MSFTRAVLIDGIRTPFQLPFTGYTGMSGDVLLAAAIRRLFSRIKVDKTDIDYVVAGNVFHEAHSSNIAHTAALKAGIACPSFALSMACISGQAALGRAVRLIEGGEADVVLAGGVEYLTDLPITWNKNVRKAVLAASKTPSMKQRTKIYSQLRWKDLYPEYLNVVEFQTKETFVTNGDKIAARFGISRDEQDEYGIRSHMLARAARANGKFPFVCSIENGESKKTFNLDNTIRKISRDKVEAMKPVNKGGTVTRATANQPCDGAAVCLLTSERVAQKLNLTPRVRISQVCFAAASPVDKLLSGTTHALAKLKTTSGLDLESADVLEFYEGFAGEILSQLKALRCPMYGRTELGLDGAVGDLDLERLNRWGGSIGLGHAFGATGIRLLLHAAARLDDEHGRLGLIAGCAGGGLGAALAITKL